MTVLSNSNTEKLPADGVRRRTQSTGKLADGSTIIYDEFSIYSLLLNAEHLEQLRKPAKEADLELRELLLKNHLAFSIATTAHGPYS